ncbi:MAG: YkgJ family cysteine cluster protein [Prolixibacteraceae bacterium]
MEPVRYYKPSQLKEMTANRKQEFFALFQKLKKKRPSKLDYVVRQLHDEAFEKFDCLTCANCCSSISPIIKDKDAERLAKGQKMKTTEFISQYLYMDDDQDYVFKQTPCPFLMADNYCCVYQDRPRACREYPHTDRNRFYQILPLTLKNCEICPIAYAITEELCKGADQWL